MANFEKGDYTTVWCKPKTKEVRKGENKGTSYEVYEGHLDTGGGKMIAITLYADQVTPVDTKDGDMFPVKVGKWKGTPKSKRGKKTW